MAQNVNAAFEPAEDTAELRGKVTSDISFKKACLFRTARVRPEMAEVFPQYEDIAGQFVRVEADSITFNPLYREFEVLFRVYGGMEPDSFVSHFFARALTSFCL